MCSCYYTLLHFVHVDELARMPFVMKLKLEDHATCVQEHRCPTVVPAMGPTTCTRGMAGEYECSNVDLLSFVPLKDLGSNGDGNDIWGWTDPDTGREYAIVGCADGSSFVDVTDPSNPLVLGFLPTHTTSSLWRDMKVGCHSIACRYVDFGGHKLRAGVQTRIRCTSFLGSFCFL